MSAAENLTDNSQVPQAVGDFTKFVASAYALALGESLKSVTFYTLLQILGYKFQKTQLQIQQVATKALGDTTESAIDKQADATQASAIAAIGQGVTGIGFETVLAWGLPAVYGKATGVNTQLGEANQQFENVSTYDQKIKDLDRGVIDQGDFVIGYNEAGAPENFEERFNALNLRENGWSEEDLEVLQYAKALDASRENEFTGYRDLKEQLKVEKEDVVRLRDSLQGQIQSWRQKISNIGMQAAAVTQGGLTTRTADAQREQAVVENLKAQLEYVANSFQRVLEAISKKIDSDENGKQAAFRTLLEGLALQNRPA